MFLIKFYNNKFIDCNITQTEMRYLSNGEPEMQVTWPLGFTPGKVLSLLIKDLPDWQVQEGTGTGENRCYIPSAG